MNKQPDKAAALVKTLDQVMTKVVADMYQSNALFSGKNRQLSVGNCTIVHEDNTYSVLDTKTQDVIYCNLFLIEAALLIGKYYQLNDKRHLSRVCKLEATYAKHYTDMQFHHHSLVTAREANDYARLVIAEDKYRHSSTTAKVYKTKIRKICEQIVKR